MESMLANDAPINRDVKNRIFFSQHVVWSIVQQSMESKDLRLQTKLRVYKAVVLTNLPYGCETWICYRRHIKTLDRFHMRHLRMLLKTKWQD